MKDHKFKFFNFVSLVFILNNFICSNWGIILESKKPTEGKSNTELAKADLELEIMLLSICCKLSPMEKYASCNYFTRVYKCFW